MPKWIDAKRTLPTETKKYFVLINGRKEIYSFYEFDAAQIDYYETFFWLDETVEDIPKNEIIHSLTNNLSIVPYTKSLVNLFGVKKAKKIISKTEFVFKK